MIDAATPLSAINGIGAKFLKKLEKLKIKTVKDLLWHFPTRYEDFSQIYKIVDLQPREEVTVQGVIKEIGGRRTWRKKLYLVEALISDDSGSIRAVWFNQPYIKNVLRPGRMANFSGKVVFGNDELYLSNPTYELLNASGGGETKHTARIVPIYPETKGLTSKGLRFLIKPLLERVEKFPEIIPPEILEAENLPEINTALYNIHFPKNLEAALAAKKRFAFEDLFVLQLFNLQQKLKLAKEKAIPTKFEIEDIKKILACLPYELTISQKRALWEIIKDLARSQPMNRLLQGDVGSGKTVVAAIAAVVTAKNGNASAFMAPTEILARQHYKTLTSLFPDYEISIALLTSSEARIFYGGGLETKTQKQKLIKEIAEGKIKIIVGTHALIQKGIIFPKLALVVVDEQHRFGVEQRAALVKNKNQIPHLLSMSATPIPRTLSLTLWGDLDLSLITELPKNRKPIITKIVPPAGRAAAYQFIRNEVKRGRQVFVICPRIEISDSVNQNPNEISKTAIQKLEIKSVKAEYEKLSKKIFPDLRVAMLHGKMRPKEKEQVMREFSERKKDILVATSVVEVGIDVPNATIMMIEGADRFGLAQLYQFRGRVGRGEHQSYCFLFTDSASPTTRQRLKSIVEAKNGFELAEKDLQIRGPGEFLGNTQTGMPDLAMKALQNPELVKSARFLALNLLQKDETLKNYPLLLTRLKNFQKEVHLE